MRGKSERVVVTGTGVASPLDCSLNDFRNGLVSDCSGVRSLDGNVLSGLPLKIGAVIWDDKDPQYFDDKEIKWMSRSSQSGPVAAEQAITYAGFESDDIDDIDTGVSVGSSVGGFCASDPNFKKIYTDNRLGPYALPVVMNVGPGSSISIRHGFQGPLVDVDAACTTAAHSSAQAFNMIRSGNMQAAVSSATDSPFSPAVVGAWVAIHAVSTRVDCPAEACRPFCNDRDGMGPGEGAGIVVLEAESRAFTRGASILAEIKGCGASADSRHLTQPTQKEPILAMRRTSSEAGLDLDDIDYINAHATGMEWNERNETRAIKGVLGKQACEIPVSGNKAAVGHSVAGSGALELGGCVLSLRDQVVPPTINYKVPDPGCDLDYLTEGCRKLPLKNIMSNSFAFGGRNAVLIVAAYEPNVEAPG